MNQIPGIEKLATLLPDGKLSRLRYVLSFKIETRQLPPHEARYDLELQICTLDAAPVCVTFVFGHVQRLRLTDWCQGPVILGGFYCDDIWSHGLERTRWRIGDFEDDSVLFDCWDAEIVAVQPVDIQGRALGT